MPGDEVNPGIVVVDSSAFGPTGPWATRMGYGPLVRAAAGEPWDGFVAHAVEQGWSGVEALSGIPGTVGAAPRSQRANSDPLGSQM